MSPLAISTQHSFLRGRSGGREATCLSASRTVSIRPQTQFRRALASAAASTPGNSRKEIRNSDEYKPTMFPGLVADIKILSPPPTPHRRSGLWEMDGLQGFSTGPGYEKPRQHGFRQVSSFD